MTASAVRAVAQEAPVGTLEVYDALPALSSVDVAVGRSRQFSIWVPGEDVRYVWLFDGGAVGDRHAWTFVPQASDLGPHRVTVSVESGAGRTQRTWTVTVLQAGGSGQPVATAAPTTVVPTTTVTTTVVPTTVTATTVAAPTMVVTTTVTTTAVPTTVLVPTTSTTPTTRAHPTTTRPRAKHYYHRRRPAPVEEEPEAPPAPSGLPPSPQPGEPMPLP